MTGSMFIFVPDTREELRRLQFTVGLTLSRINRRRPAQDHIENLILISLSDITERMIQLIQDIIDHP